MTLYEINFCPNNSESSRLFLYKNYPMCCHQYLVSTLVVYLHLYEEVLGVSYKSSMTVQQCVILLSWFNQKYLDINLQVYQGLSQLVGSNGYNCA